ncbi:hypothetical protein ACLKA7_000761 [Drosophila subpalustris]
MSPPSVHRSEQQFLVSQESFQQSLRYPSSNQDQVLNPCGNKDTHNDLRSNQDQVNSPCGNENILSSPCGNKESQQFSRESKGKTSFAGRRIHLGNPRGRRICSTCLGCSHHTHTHTHTSTTGRRAQQAPGGPVPGADAAATTPVKDPYRIPTNPEGRQHETTPASTNIVII